MQPSNRPNNMNPPHTARKRSSADSEYLTMDEVATILGISRVTVYRLIDSDPDFVTFHVGRQRRMSRAALNAWVELQQTRY